MIFFSGSTRLVHPPNSPSQIPKNHQIHHSMYQKHQTNHAKHQTNHAKYKIHHLLFTLSGQHTASPPRGQHPNPPSSSWKDIIWEETKDWSVYKYQQQQNIRSIISIQIFEVAHICQALLEKKSLAAIKKGGQCSMNTVHTNWTAGLRVVAGVLRVWAGFPVGRKIKNIGTDRRSKKSHTYKRRCDYQRRLWHL